MYWKKNRKRIRLQNHDYRIGSYFVTICCRERMRLLGEIEGKTMVKNQIGLYAEHAWSEIPLHFPGILADEFIAMPNHIHGILHLPADRLQGKEAEFRPNEFARPRAGSLSMIIGHLKGAVTRYARNNGFDYFGWQGRFHDVWIKEGEDISPIRAYIRSNPMNWKEDDLFY